MIARNDSRATATMIKRINTLNRSVVYRLRVYPNPRYAEFNVVGNRPQRMAINTYSRRSNATAADIVE